MTEVDPTLEAPAPVHSHPPPRGFLRKWVFSTDHKIIGLQYLGISLFWALAGGALAYVVRYHLAWPEDPVPGAGWVPEPYTYEGYVGPEGYNSVVTMHGTIMVFFVAMPLLLGAFGNYLIPLMIGARDMAFPRLNMASVWTLGLASLVLLASFVVPGGAAAAGWTAYAPLSARAEYTGVEWGQNLWIIALALEFASFLMGGVNFLTTAINMRTRGMTLGRMPLYVWMTLTASVLFMLSVGPLIAGAIMLLMDRVADTSFFVPAGGGQPILWQHLFWYFGHPEVYVILLPGLGIILEVLPVFSRKPVFGYWTIIGSTIVAGVLSFIVWAHHMFISGINPYLAMPFSLTTILISVPFAIAFFAMIATLWRGSIRYPTAMLFALGTLSVFVMGGLTGIFNGSAPADIYIHDTYFVVAHFHYTLISVTFFASFSGIYFWFPKWTGRTLNETLGRIHFAATFLFFNATFIPMHFVGIGGMMRRIANPLDYDFLVALQPLNEIITYFAILLIGSQIVFVVNFFWSLLAGKRTGENPWQANTLEWATSSPPPHDNWGHEPEPTVLRGPYEYSHPDADEDWLPQHAPAPTGGAS